MTAPVARSTLGRSRVANEEETMESDRARNVTRRRRAAVGSAAVLAAAVAAAGLGLASAAGAGGRARCDARELSGAYGFAATGAAVVPGKTVQFASGGTAIFDGRGSVAGVLSESNAGAIEQGTRYEGTYELSPSCTGSATLLVHHPAGAHFHHFDLVLVDGGNGLALVATDPGFVFAFSMERQLR